MKKVYKMDGDFILGKEKIKVKEYVLDICSNYYTDWRGDRQIREGSSCEYGYKLVNEAGEKVADLTRKKYKGKNNVWYTSHFSFIKNGIEFLLRLTGWGFEKGKLEKNTATLTSRPAVA